MPLMKALRESPMPVRGFVWLTSHQVCQSIISLWPCHHFPLCGQLLFPLLNSALWKLNTAVSSRSLRVAMGYVTSKLKMEPKQALKYQPSSGKLKGVLQHRKRNQVTAWQGKDTAAAMSWTAASWSLDVSTAAKNILSTWRLQVMANTQGHESETVDLC